MDVLGFLKAVFALPVKLLLTVVGLISVILETVFFLVDLVFSYIYTVITLCPAFLRPFVLMIGVIRLAKFLMKRGNSRNAAASSEFSSVTGHDSRETHFADGTVSYTESDWVKNK